MPYFKRNILRLTVAVVMLEKHRLNEVMNDTSPVNALTLGRSKVVPAAHVQILFTRVLSDLQLASSCSRRGSRCEWGRMAAYRLQKTRSLLKEAVESLGPASQTTSADSSPGPSALPSALMERHTYQNYNTLHPTLALVGSQILNATLTSKSGAKPPPKPKPTWQSSSRLENGD